MRKLIMVLALLLLAATPVFAAVTVGTFGAPNSDGTYPLTVDSDRSLTVATDAGFLRSYETATTADTLTVADCGKTFLVTPTTNTTFTLPTQTSAFAGCVYTFYATTGQNFGTTAKLIIDPAATDMFRGMINSAANTTFAIGESMISPGVTGDTIAVMSSGTTIWDVVLERGTWVDNN